jgi:hypothetical protein
MRIDVFPFMVSPSTGSGRAPELRKIFDISDIGIIMLLVTLQKE